jgi:hypothetical protein
MRERKRWGGHEDAMRMRCDAGKDKRREGIGERHSLPLPLPHLKKRVSHTYYLGK